MIKNEFFQYSYTTHSGFSKPQITRCYDVDRVNYVYLNPEQVKLIRQKEKSVRKKNDFSDHYLYFCGTINYLRHDKRFEEKEFVSINYETMISIVSEFKYPEIVNNLTNWDFVESNGSYQGGYSSTGYKIKPPYNKKLKKIMIKNKLINQKINKHREKELQKLHQLPYPYQYLEMTNTWIKINARAANRFNFTNYFGQLNKSGEINRKYDSNFISISDLATESYRFKMDEFGKRAHTNLTSLNKRFRYTLSVQGDKIGQVDISNSQPLFLYSIIKDEPEISTTEKQEYKSMVEDGRFYEYFMDHFNIPYEKREDTKQKILIGMFSDKNRSDSSRYFNYFNEKFPQIATYIAGTKKENYKNLICKMQREESRFVIEKVVAEFIDRYDGEFISTIHDSIVVKTEMLDTAYDLMLECFKEEGMQPKLKVKVFNKYKEV